MTEGQTASSADQVRLTKPCPFCAETILAVAVKCKHCGEFLDLAAAPRASQAAPPPQLPMPVVAPPSSAPRYAGRAGNSPKVVCPQCGVVGGVDVDRVRQKKGISGGKATAAVLTAGISILATGLSRKEKVSEAHCKNCNVIWTIR